MVDYKTHRMYSEFEQLLKDDAGFADMYADTADDFNEWVLDYEIDSDWETEV